MKKLSLYVFLVLMWCNVGFAKDLTGTKLICLWGYNVKSPFYDSYIAFDFISLDQVKVHKIKNLKYNNFITGYKVDVLNIRIIGESDQIERTTLKFGKFNCRKFEDHLLKWYKNMEEDIGDIESFMKFKLKEFIEEQNKLNKI